MEEIRKCLEPFESDLIDFKKEAVEKALENLDLGFRKYIEYDSTDEELAPACGHIFKANDIIYRCSDCTFDPTCVLCEDCFMETDHVGHRVHFSISNNSGGCCDCGEDESWSRELSCPKHSEKIQKVEKDTLNVDTLNVLTLLITDITTVLTGDLFSKAIKLQNTALAPTNYVIFNDEVHSFADVIETLIQTELYSESEAADIASAVDLHGFASICKDGQEVGMDNVRMIAYNGLHIDLFPRSDLLDYTYAYIGLFWLTKNCLGNEIIRKAISDILLNNSLIENYFLMDSTLTKGTRKLISEIMIRCVLPFPEAKQKLGVLYGKLYSMMVENYLKESREPENSLVHFGVQLFTSSSISREILTMFPDFIQRQSMIASTYINDYLKRPNSPRERKNLHTVLSVFGYLFKDLNLIEDSLFANSHFLESFLIGILKSCNFMNIQKLQEGEHVLYESDLYIKSFEVHIQVQEIMSDLALHLNSLEKIDMVFDIFTKHDSLFVLPADSMKQVSLHHMSAAFFSFILRSAYALSPNPKQFKDVLSRLPSPLWTLIGKSVLFIISTLFDISNGKWALNGLAMRHQAFLALDSFKTFFLDAYLTCAKACMVALGETFFVFLSDPFYNDTRVKILSKMVFSISLHPYNSLAALKECITAILSTGNYSYSDLEQMIPDKMLENKGLIVLLDQVAIRIHDTSIKDSQFSLKPDFKGAFLPLFSIFSATVRSKFFEKFIKQRGNMGLVDGDTCLVMEAKLCSAAFRKIGDILLSSYNQALNFTTEEAEELLFLSYFIIRLENSGICDVVAIKSLIENIGEKFSSNASISGLCLEISKLLRVESAVEEISETNMSHDRKKLARLTRLKALQEVQRKQSDFLEANDSFEIEDSLADEKCIICQESLTAKNDVCLYACNIQQQNLADTFTVATTKIEKKPEKIPFFRITTCNHIVHRSCYSELCASKSVLDLNELKTTYKCPLCSSYLNWMLPLIDPSVLCKMSVDFTNHIPYDSSLSFIRDNPYSRISLPALDSLSENLVQSARKSLLNIMNLDGGIVNFGSLFKQFFASNFAFWLESDTPPNPGFIANFIRVLQYWFSSELEKEYQIIRKAVFQNNSDDVSDNLSVFNLHSCIGIIFCFRQDLKPDEFLALATLGLYSFKRSELELPSKYHLILSKICDQYLNILKVFSYAFFGPENFEKFALKMDENSDRSLPMTTQWIPNFSLIGDYFVLPDSLFIDLPHRYDFLLRNTLKKPCARCQILPNCPALCLICSAIVCAKSFCCFEDNFGECNLHVKNCCVSGGIFILLKENALLLLGSNSTVFEGKVTQTPYENIFGQSDIGLKRGELLFFKPERLDNFRRLFLKSNVDSYLLQSGENSSRHAWNLF